MSNLRGRRIIWRVSYWGDDVEKVFPVSDKLQVIGGITIEKTGELWSAVLIVKGYKPKPKLAFYTWRMTPNGWKRLYKFSVDIELWGTIKERTDKLLEER